MQWTNRSMPKIHQVTMKKCFDINKDAYLVLLQKCSIPFGPRLPSPAVLWFNRPIVGLIPILNRPPLLFDHNDDHYEALIKRQQNAHMTKDTQMNSLFLPT